MKSAPGFFASFRLLYTLPFVLAAAAGSAPMLGVPGKAAPALLIMAEAFLLGLFVNLSNDLADHRSGSDRLRFDISRQERELIFGERGMLPAGLFWQGNPFDLGLADPRTGKRALILIVAAVALLLVPLTLMLGPGVPACAALALLLAWAYSGRPFYLDRRGFGEALTGTGFMLLTGCASFLLRGGAVPADAAAAAAVGSAAFLMRGTDSLTGLRAHRAAGEKDLAALLGVRGAVRLLSAAAMVPHAAALSFPAPHGFGGTRLLPLAALPLSCAVVIILRREAAKAEEALGRFVPAVVPALLHFTAVALLFAVAA